MAIAPHTLRDLHWSPAEKKAARAAFDAAMERERAAIRKEVETMLARSADSSGVWRAHDFLSEKRREFDQKYDYRYSVLIRVFAHLLHEGWVTEADLAGLGAEKLELVRNMAAAFRELEA
jgi:Photoprotection regulator fluorescence recovery protein